MTTKVYLLDEMTPRPGMWDKCRGAYLNEYAPGARSRGMVLEQVWATPPFPLQERTGLNSLMVLWSVGSAAEYWQMRLQAEAAKAEFWGRVVNMTVARHRSVLSDLGDFEAYSRV
jgi:hypothetical protein